MYLSILWQPPVNLPNYHPNTCHEQAGQPHSNDTPLFQDEGDEDEREAIKTPTPLDDPTNALVQPPCTTPPSRPAHYWEELDIMAAKRRMEYEPGRYGWGQDDSQFVCLTV